MVTVFAMCFYMKKQRFAACACVQDEHRFSAHIALTFFLSNVEGVRAL
jgi:hypothetical protein